MTDRALTMADVLEELNRIGADLTTTTFDAGYGLISHLDGEYEIRRVDGAAVVTFLGYDDEGPDS